MSRWKAIRAGWVLWLGAVVAPIVAAILKATLPWNEAEPMAWGCLVLVAVCGFGGWMVYDMERE